MSDVEVFMCGFLFGFVVMGAICAGICGMNVRAGKPQGE